MTTPVQPKEIRIQDNFNGGDYANALQVAHNRDEIVLTFANLVPPSGRVVAKIMTTPAHLKRMISACQDNLAKYEAKFGTVAPSEHPKKGIGFATDDE